MGQARVLLIGWDAADWKMIRPLLDAGQMPNLARLVAGGVRGNVATIYPVLSPMLWTSIATGKRAYKHGIHGFSEPLPGGNGVRPITLLSRKTKAVWNILNQNGHRSIVVGWWPSHPAEPIHGIMVSNLFQEPSAKPGEEPPLAAGIVHPASLSPALGDLRVNPMELTGEFIRLFVPEYEKVDQAKDKRLHTLGKIIAETMSIHAVSTELLATEPWDFAAIYYSGIDHFGHAFMSYHPPRLPWVKEEDFAIYQSVMANAYRYHDGMLGALLGLVDDNTTVILMSDHGFHPDHLRPSYIPAEPAGPAVEHRHFGILCLKGPALRVNEPLYGASLLDVCPTILTLFGLPPGRDMDGKVLSTVFKQAPRIDPIESWDAVPGDAGTHSAETRLDPVASAQAFKQLVDLGYVAPPGPNVQDTVDECVRELRYNLARAYLDGDCCGEAVKLAEELWTRWPEEHRFGLLLVDALTPIGLVVRRREVIEELGRRIEKYQQEATAHLADREHPKPAESRQALDPAERRRLYEERRLRELAGGRPLMMEWLWASQALLENKRGTAREHLEKLAAAEGSTIRMNQRVAGAMAELGTPDVAEAMLQEALELDPENALAHAQLAALHTRAGRHEKAIAAAVESLSLQYYQPVVHALLGRAFMKTGRFPEAEKELLVAVAQSPRNLAAHETLGQLYRQHLNRPADAFAHEGRALSLQHELAAQQRAHEKLLSAPVSEPALTREAAFVEQRVPDELPASFEPPVDPGNVVTVVSGLPRSGTSMMMQMLVAAGREALYDAARAANEDNLLGYFEFQKTLELRKDSSWLPQARGKVVKVVAQLLPALPRTEHYHVLFMERDLREVIASQNIMLARQNRRGAEMDPQRLLETYRDQVARVRRRLARCPEIRLLRVDYAQLLADPRAGVNRIAEFLGGPFDSEAAVRAIHPELRRQTARDEHGKA